MPDGMNMPLKKRIITLGRKRSNHEYRNVRHFNWCNFYFGTGRFILGTGKAFVSVKRQISARTELIVRRFIY